MILMLGGIVDHLDTVLIFQGVFLLAWAAILASILTVAIAIFTNGAYYVKEEAEDIPKEDYIA